MSRKTEVQGQQTSNTFPTDPGEIARVESLNALQQFDFAMYVVELEIKSKKPFRLDRPLIFELNRLATQGLGANAGKPRQVMVCIRGSDHKPPHWSDVSDMLMEMCQYVNDHPEASPIHLAAYVIWRINWIHPFEDGNGRTARMLSYIILCVGLKMLLPGTKTIPEQIVENKQPYYIALEAADAAFKKGILDLRALEALLSDMLARQLLDVHTKACGATGTIGP